MDTKLDMPMLVIPGTCADCRHWLTNDGKQGVCRRYPPMPVIIGFAPQSAIHDPSKPQAGVPVVNAFFPPMLAMGACGEHEPKERTQ